MVEMHEFFLKFDDKTARFYKITLGELILETERETLTEGWKLPQDTNNSGSIGFIDLYWNPSPETIEILEFGIEPAFRGREYARTLYERAEAFAKENGAKEIVLPSVVNDKIRRISRRYGYEPDGRRLVKRL